MKENIVINEGNCVEYIPYCTGIRSKLAGSASLKVKLLGERGGGGENTHNQALSSEAMQLFLARQTFNPAHSLKP
jgi:hypothetical protein